MGSCNDSVSPVTGTCLPPAGRGYVVHALAIVLAAAVAWLVFAAYRQPDFILDFAGMRLC